MHRHSGTSPREIEKKQNIRQAVERNECEAERAHYGESEQCINENSEQRVFHRGRISQRALKGRRTESFQRRARN